MFIVSERSRFDTDIAKAKKRTSTGRNYRKSGTVIDMINDPKASRKQIIRGLDLTLSSLFPPLKGDEVTFIGSTFLKYGEPAPYLNHCIVKGTCDTPDNVVIETKNTEGGVLLAWSKLIAKENPDIVISYNTTIIVLRVE